MKKDELNKNWNSGDNFYLKYVLGIIDAPLRNSNMKTNRKKVQPYSALTYDTEIDSTLF